MFSRPANPYDLDQRHNRPDKRGLLPFSHRLQPQPGKRLQPGLQIKTLNHTVKKPQQIQKEKPQQGK